MLKHYLDIFVAMIFDAIKFQLSNILKIFNSSGFNFCSENWIHERWTNEFIINNYVVIDITNQERMNLFEID